MYKPNVLDVAKKSPYPPRAFALVLESMEATKQYMALGRIKESDYNRVGEHISGQELCEGFRLYCIDAFGRMAPFVLHRLNLKRTEDIGRIIFLLCENELLGKTDADDEADFADGYSFQKAFSNIPIE